MHTKIQAILFILSRRARMPVFEEGAVGPVSNIEDSGLCVEQAEMVVSETGGLLTEIFHAN
jgi:hypothetical protein